MIRMSDLVRGGSRAPTRPPDASPLPSHVRMSSLSSPMRADDAAGGAEVPSPPGQLQASTPAAEDSESTRAAMGTGIPVASRPTESAAIDEAGAATVDVAPSEPSDHRVRQAYRHALGGFAVVLLLVSAIAGITARQMEWVGWSEAPRGLKPPPSEDRTAGPDAPAPPPRLSSSTVTAASPVPVPVAALPPAEAPAGAESAVTPSPTPPLPEASVSVPASTSTVATSVPGRENAVKEPAAIAQGPRFAVEFGPFLTGADAERTERQVTQAGYPTVRFRQQTGAALYAVLVERPPGAREAQALVEALREQGIQEPVVPDGGDSLNVPVGEPLLLRAAVQLAESLRARGHRVRVAAQPGEAQTFVIRHGNFASRDEAEARSAELARLGLPNYVVRAK